MEKWERKEVEIALAWLQRTTVPDRPLVERAMLAKYVLEDLLRKIDQKAA